MITLQVSKILTQKGKSRYWLAKQCDISQNNILKICNGETNSIRLETIEKICLALECTPNDIIVSDNPKLTRLLAYHNSINKQSDTE